MGKTEILKTLMHDYHVTKAIVSYAKVMGLHRLKHFAYFRVDGRLWENTSEKQSVV